MALNEVWAPPICRIAALINGNGLKHSDAAMRERRSQLIEIVWPITFANRLEHLNRDDAVIAPLNVPVIKQAQIGASVLDFAGEARLGVSKLFGRERYTNHGAAMTTNEPFGQRPPTTADLQDAFAPSELKQARNTIEL